MAVRRDTPKSLVWDRPLTWSPPTLSSPRVVTVTETDLASRNIQLSNGEDLLLQMPNVISTYNPVGQNLAMVQVLGGRNVVLIGGHVTITDVPITSVVSSVADGDTTINVSSTAGFPSSGSIRVDGEYINYDAKTSTSFTSCTRNFGFYNTSAVSSNTAHAAGATVYASESYRSAFSFRHQTGTVHIEGVLIDGAPICDGIDITAQTGTIFQVQNCRIGPVTAYDLTYSTDGHPDCIQIIEGPDVLRMDRVTMLQGMGAVSKGLLNSGSDNGRIMPAGICRDVEVLSQGGLGPQFYNGDTSTSWTFLNTWCGPVPGGAAVSQDSALLSRLLVKSPADGAADFCPASVAGEHYSSPGYL